MCPNISLIAPKKYLKKFFVRVNYNNLTITFFVLFCYVFLFHSQYLFFAMINFHQFLFWAYSHENINQFYNLTHCVVFACLLLQINSLFLYTDCSLVKMTSFCLHPNLVLNLHVAVVLQSIIALAANSLHIKVLLDCFFGLSTSSYLMFSMIWKILYCSDLQIFMIKSFCFTFHSNPLSVFTPFFHLFLCLYPPYLYSIFPSFFMIFDFFLCHYIL